MIWFCLVTFCILFVNTAIIYLVSEGASLTYKLKYVIYFYVLVYMLGGVAAHIMMAGWVRLLIDGKMAGFEYFVALLPWLIMFWMHVGFVYEHAMYGGQHKLTLVEERYSSHYKRRIKGRYLQLPKTKIDLGDLWNAFQHCYGGCPVSLKVQWSASAVALVSLVTVVF